MAVTFRSVKGSGLTNTEIDQNFRLSHGFDTVAALLAYTGSLVEGDTIPVRTGGHCYQVAASGASDHHLTTAGGAKLYILPRDGDTISIAAFGISAGGDIGQSMLKAWNTLLADKGGTIYIPAGDWESANTVFPATAKTITIQGCGTETNISPSDPVAGTFMWDFQGTDGGTVTKMELRRFVIQGDDVMTFNGIRIGPSNMLIMDRVQGRNIVGTAFKLIRHFNSQLYIETYLCGDEANDRWAVHMTGDPTSGKVFNDCLFTGASEQDELGWLLEGGSGIIRTSAPVKIHGSQTAGKAIRGLQIHRMDNFNIQVIATLGCTASGFIHVSDANSGDGIALLDSHANAPSITQGRLDIHFLKNFRAVGTSQTFDYVTIDCAASGSDLVVTGHLPDTSTGVVGSGMDYRWIGLAAPGLGNARLDFTGLIPANISETSKIIDDRRTSGTIGGAFAYDAATDRIVFVPD